MYDEALRHLLISAIRYGYTTQEIAEITNMSAQDVNQFLLKHHMQAKKIFKYGAINYQQGPSIFCTSLSTLKEYFRKNPLTPEYLKKKGYVYCDNLHFHWAELPTGCIYSAAYRKWEWRIKISNDAYQIGKIIEEKK